MTTKKDIEEIKFLLDAYRRYRFDSELVKHLPGNFYTDAELWLKEQGCELDIFTMINPIPRWESESKRVEFYLRWM